MRHRATAPPNARTSMPMDVDVCHHSEWIEVSRAANACLVDPGRLDRLATSLHEPYRQCPQIVLCIGGEQKRRAIRALFPQHNSSQNNSSQHAPSGHDSPPRDPPRPASARSRPLQSLAHLHVDESRAHLPYPVLFADCTPNAPIAVRDRRERCHAAKWIDEAGPIPLSTLETIVLPRLLFPFADTICVFADDFGGLDAVFHRLEDWSADNVPTTVPWRARPRVSVITSATSTAAAFRDQKVFTSRLRTLKFRRHFSSVRLVAFPMQPDAAASDRALCRHVLCTELDMARAQRKYHRVFFTALHLSWFFSRAIRHVAAKSDEPFDFVLAASSFRALHPQYPDRLCAFVRLAVQHHVNAEQVIQILASSIMLDAYPPSGHKFCPVLVFYTVYAPAVRRALEEVVAPSVAAAKFPDRSTHITYYLGRIVALISGWVDDSDSMKRQPSQENSRARESSAEELSKACFDERDTYDSRCDKTWAQNCHLRNVERLRDQICWGKIVSNSCCILCLANVAQHSFTCTHAVCDTCVKRFGRPQAEQEYCYAFAACPLCGTPSPLRIILRPPTAGIRILSVDGGGVRGVVPLQFLRLLQAAIGRAGRIQDYFDIGFGVSAGAIIIHALLGLGWDVARCTTFFCEYARRTLHAPLVGQTLRPASIPALIQCLITDGHYSAESVPSALRECVGGTRRLFDHPITGTSRCKIAVTATTTDDVSTVIFPNYNLAVRDGRGGPEKHRERALASYHRFPRDRPEAEPRLWEVLGATSAAPPYFHPVQVGQGGRYQDGALHNPNPTDIAIEESDAISDARRDLILSLGTGLPPPLDSGPPKPYRLRRSWDCSGLRLMRGARKAVLDAWDAEKVHQTVLRWLNALDTHSAERYHRLNLVSTDRLPPLDDVRCMESLMHHAERCSDVQKLPQIVATLLASSFFLELDGMPEDGSDGQYMCSGTIRIRGNPKDVLELARTMNAGRIQFVKGADELGSLQLENPLCTSCGRFHQPVRFSVPELEGFVLISLQLERGATYRISGFPQSMRWFIAKQSLDDPFAHAVAPEASSLCHSLSGCKPLVVRKRGTERRTRSATVKRRKTGYEGQTWI